MTSPTPTWRAAWDDALYGPDGFYRRESPRAHFRTSVHASPLFAAALVRLARERGLGSVVDIGAGRGELLTTIRALDPGLGLLGVEVARRPPSLPSDIGWTARLPDTLDGLVVANEWLDNIPCQVTEVDEEGGVRMVHVDPGTGEESLGSLVGDPAVPAGVASWLARWWPLEGAEPGRRAEVGSTRDSAWADVLGRLRRGLALAVDYGHTRASRPALGSLRSYLAGREVAVLPDGSRDLTAHVAVDSLAAAVGGTVRRQRDALRELGVRGDRPDLSLARSDPAGYVAALSAASEAAELTDPDGLGAFFWVTAEV